MGALVTPEYVNQLADALQASGAEKAVAFALAATPLPEGFSSIAKEDGTVEFVSPAGPSPDHPLLANAAAALERHRADAAGPGAGTYLGPFEDFDSPGTEFFYMDVASGERLAEAEVPPSAIIPQLAEQLQQLLLTGAAPGEAVSMDAAASAEVDAGAAGTGGDVGEGEASAAAAPGPGSEAVSRAASQRSAAAAGAGAAGSEAGGAGAGEEPVAPASAGPASRSASQRSGLGSGPGAEPSGAAEADLPVAGSQAASRTASLRAAGDVAAASTGPTSVPGSAAVSRSASHQRSDAGGAGAPASRTASQRSAGADGTAPQPATQPGSQAASRNASMREPGLNGSMGLRSQPSQGTASVAGSASEAGGGGATTAAATAAASEPRDSPASGSPTMEGAARSLPVGRTVSYAGLKVSMFAAAATEKDGGGGSGSGGMMSARSGHLAVEDSRALSTALSTKSLGLGGGPSRGALSSAVSSKSLGLGRDGLSRAMSSKSVGNTAEQQAALTGGLGVKPPVPPAGGKLTFFGWWYEDVESTDLTLRVDSKSQAGGGLAARHCRLVFDFDSQTYTFTMKDPVSPAPPGTAAPNHVPELTLRAIQPDQVLLPESGRQAAVWDLHLGSRLRVLGRVVTLKNAELATIQWHDHYCRKMAAIRDAIAQEIQKYRPRALRPGLLKDRGAPQLGGRRLRHMAGQVRELINDLRQYRPARADNYLANMPIVFVTRQAEVYDDFQALLYGLHGVQVGDE